MFDSSTLITFLVAGVAIIIAPGPAQALVLTRTLGEGRAAGAMTAVRLNVGTLAHAFAAALGLSAILAFLPQFVAPERGSAFWHFVILGAILAALDVIYELILVWAAGALRGRVLGSRRFAQWRRRVTGAALIGLGARLALAQRQ